MTNSWTWQRPARGAQVRLRPAPPTPPSPLTDPACDRGDTNPLAQAISLLEFGLMEDYRLACRAERAGRPVEWELFTVLADLPARYRPANDARFVRRLVRVGFALTHDISRDRAAPDCPAQFLLARWLLDRALSIAEADGRPALRASELAQELGLALAGHGPAFGTSDEPWPVDLLRVDPAEWFVPAITGLTNASPGRRVHPADQAP